MQLETSGMWRSNPINTDSSTNHSRQDLAPKISESIKTAGLVLISDISADTAAESSERRQLGPPSDGVDGVLRSNGVLRFHDSVDI
jgi:CDK inhibitor PHO81